MWDQIQKNKTRSILLLAALAALLVVLGTLTGAAIGAYSGANPSAAAYIGMSVSLLVFLGLVYYSMGAGARQILHSVRARPITKADLPQLYNVVEEMRIASGLGHMPAIYLIDDNNPNAFAVGQNAEQSAVAVTWGLLRRLNRDELQGVIAHEIGHIKNRDALFLTTAASTVGAIAILCEAILRVLWHSNGGGGRRSRGKDGAGGAQIILLILLVLAAILAPLFAQLLYFACSRRREYLADASAARFTRLPAALASALEKIAGVTIPPEKDDLNKVVLPMYIVNPLQLHGASGWYSTHPPTEERVDILRAMSGAGFVDYEQAYKKVYGSGKNCIGAQSLAAEGSVVARAAAAGAPIVPADDLRREDGLGEGADVDHARSALDLLDQAAGFGVIPCACGVRIKLPPNFTQPAVRCARCGRTHQTSAAQSPQQATESRQVIARKRTGWQTVRCDCGRRINISPEFIATHINCPNCNRQTPVEYD